MEKLNPELRHVIQSYSSKLCSLHWYTMFISLQLHLRGPVRQASILPGIQDLYGVRRGAGRVESNQMWTHHPEKTKEDISPWFFWSSITEAASHFHWAIPVLSIMAQTSTAPRPEQALSLLWGVWPFDITSSHGELESSSSGSTWACTAWYCSQPKGSGVKQLPSQLTLLGISKKL